jgi:uncharacterized protein YuzE
VAIVSSGCDAPVAETRELDENTILDVDKDGNICSITIEHASVSFQRKFDINFTADAAVSERQSASSQGIEFDALGPKSLRRAVSNQRCRLRRFTFLRCVCHY